MTSAAGVTYTYDGDGRRVKKSSGKLYWYGLGGEVLAESNLSGTVSDEYVFFGGKRIARRQSSGTVHYYFADHLDSSRVVTSATGAILDDADFYPFGGERVVTSSSGNAYKFTGKERDSESGLDYFLARYYASAMGRFMSPDDFWKDSSVRDPQSWNKYAYARNNPLRYIDPTGEEATVSTQCNQEKKTCQVNVSATVSIYTNDKNISQEKLNEVAAKIKSDIERAWSGSFAQDGVTYNVTTSVSVSTAENESAALKSGAQNVIEIANEGPQNQIYPNLTGGPDRGFLKINDVLQTPAAAHEFTHLLGVDDKSGRNLSNSELVEGGWATTARASQQDFRWALGPTVKGNSWIRQGGRRNPDGSRTIGPPFKNEPWWK
jgi:RHS repeat-associated protein